MTPLGFLDVVQPAWWPTFVLVSARVVGLLLVAPLWAMTGVPSSVRSALAVVLSVGLLPSVPRATLPADFLALPIPLATELLLGLAIGLVGAVFMQGVAMAGEVVMLQMGLNLGQSLAPMVEVGASGVGELKSLLALTIYATLGGHLVLLAAVQGSFGAIPPGGAIDMTAGAHAVITLAGTVFSTAVRAAAPIMVALLLVNLALAILNRAVPQLNGMAIAFPITTGIGLVLLGAALPFFARYVGDWTGGMGATAASVVRAFTPARS